jgi:beta-lactamase regulating signal transducer with metallopeptidase domain
MNPLVELTLRGSAAAIVVMALDRALAGRMSCASRRWWWCFVPVAFLAPVRIPVLPPPDRMPGIEAVSSWAPARIPQGMAIAAAPGAAIAPVAEALWISGSLATLALVAIQTARASRRWSRERLSTDHSLLELLEDCKAETGVTAPIGLVVSRSVPSPAILGWLRPRILLPAALAESASAAELRPILLHELAHFRWYDVPFNWLCALVRAVHWFNPVAHLAGLAWGRFREEAADEAAMGWMQDVSGQAYGEALIRTLRRSGQPAAPFGALAIVESATQLKRRITMISLYRNKSRRILLAGAVSLLLASLVCLKSARAADSAAPDPKAAALASALGWLKEIDGGQYEQSWKDAAAVFQGKLTADQWVQALNGTRAPLGTCSQRTEVSATLSKDPRTPEGVIPGEFVVVQFESSFDNLKHAVETVSLSRGPDGAWRSCGYLIRP